MTELIFVDPGMKVNW